jgi:hypothetical protein
VPHRLPDSVLARLCPVAGGVRIEAPERPVNGGVRTDQLLLGRVPDRPVNGGVRTDQLLLGRVPGGVTGGVLNRPLGGRDIPGVNGGVTGGV